MRIVVNMFFNLEGFVGGLHLHTDIDVQTLGRIRSSLIPLTIHCILRVISILHEASFIFLIQGFVYTSRLERVVHLIHHIELTGQVDHRTSFSLFVDDKEWRNACSTSHVRIVSTKCRSNMYDTGTVFCRYIITRDHTECFFFSVYPIPFFIHIHRFHPWEELFVLHTNQVGTLVFANNFERNQFVAFLIIFQGETFCLLVEVSIQKRFCQNNRHLLT